jgi:hypothetical protein
MDDILCFYRLLAYPSKIHRIKKKLKITPTKIVLCTNTHIRFSLRLNTKTKKEFFTMADDKKRIWVIPVVVRKEEEETQRKRAVQTKIKKVTPFSSFY